MDQIKTTIWSERVFCVQTAGEEDDELHETVTKETRGQGIGYRSDEERIIEIELERLRDFKNHPFRVKADAQMGELTESIRHYRGTEGNMPLPCWVIGKCRSLSAI